MYANKYKWRETTNVTWILGELKRFCSILVPSSAAHSPTLIIQLWVNSDDKKSVTQFKWIKIHLNAWLMYNSVQYENEANLPSKAFLCFPRWHFKHEIAMTRFKQDWVSALSLAFLPSSSFLLTRKTQCGFISCNLFALGIKRVKMEIFTATQFG